MDEFKQMELEQPETRIELVDGQFLFGGDLLGSRWLLREILTGWGTAFAIPFASPEDWWTALRQVYNIPTMPTEALARADRLAEHPIQIPPLGSNFVGEHWFARRRLVEDLHRAVGFSSVGRAIGSDFVMRLGNDGFTPDVMVMLKNNLEGRYHNWYFDGAADVIIEVILPEHTEQDRQMRWQRYERGGVRELWLVDPVAQIVEFWRLTAEGYQRQAIDADGRYRGIPDLPFVPAHLWTREEQKLPLFETGYRKSDWVIREVEGEELGWGSEPFEPTVALEPVSIRFEQFISWCPEAKLEGYGGHYPVLGGSLGTRHALGMLLMTLGLIEVVQLQQPKHWVRALVEAQQDYAQDAEKREQWWAIARQLAEQLQADYRIGGVGVIGSLVEPHPLHRGSELRLVVWDIPDNIKLWQVFEALDCAIAFDLIDPEGATPAEWRQIERQMVVLRGNWTGEAVRRRRKRMQFEWLE
jgi:Putative restriction endonuclease